VLKRLKNHGRTWSGIVLALLLLCACAASPPATEGVRPTATNEPPATQAAMPTTMAPPTATATPTMTSEATATSAPPGKTDDTPWAEVADVISVEVTASPGAYQFSVGIASPDTGCDQYADWWEVIDEGGDLIYRRILLHSHVNEQPFVRSGGPVAIDPDVVVWVRAHMNPTGYGGTAFKGSVQSGFQEAKLDPGFAIDLLHESPLPDGCAF
jgi:hypothetical protein